MSISKDLTILFSIIQILYISCSAESLGEVRQFTTAVNPGCEEYKGLNCSDLTLLHIRSDGKQDSFHFLWSFVGAPTLLMTRTGLDSNLSIEWDRMISPSKTPTIEFSPPPHYSFGWSLVKVYMADDSNDSVSFDKINETSIYGYPTKNFIWERVENATINNSTHVRYTLVSKNYNYGVEEGGVRDLGHDGYFKFTIRMQSSEGYSDVLPYMLYSENSTEVDVAFNDVRLNTTDSPYPGHPRVGFKYILVQDPFDGVNGMRIERTKTLDDEHTPGVFETYSIRTPVINGTDQSFIQWKPICYTAEVRDVIDSVDVWSYPLKNASSVNGDDNIQDSILWSFYGSDIDRMLLESTRISFGTQQDGFYNKTKHISWTYSTGFGDPPKDFVSLVVLAIVAVGLGIPIIIIILSVAYVVVKRLKRPRDELLLGQ